MNQYRCNNGCSHLVKYDFCSVVRDYVREDEESWISKVGCASHSDFQSERDKVLDEVQRIRDKMTHSYGMHRGYIYSESFKEEVEKVR